MSSQHAVEPLAGLFGGDHDRFPRATVSLIDEHCP